MSLCRLLSSVLLVVTSQAPHKIRTSATRSGERPRYKSLVAVTGQCTSAGNQATASSPDHPNAAPEPSVRATQTGRCHQWCWWLPCWRSALAPHAQTGAWWPGRPSQRPSVSRTRRTGITSGWQDEGLQWMDHTVRPNARRTISTTRYRLATTTTLKNV